MKNNKSKNIEHFDISRSLEVSMIDKSLKELTTDVVELSIDSLFEESVLRNLPIIKTFYNLYSFGVSIQDKLFLKKVLSFLNQISDIPAKKREDFIQKVKDDKKYRIKIGEKLLYILDSCNDHESSERVGFLFRFFLEEKITRSEFEKISFIISAMSNNDFSRVISVCRKLIICSEKDHCFDLIYLDQVSDLLYVGIFDIFYTEPSVVVSPNDYPDGYKSSPMNKYVAEVEEEIRGYVKLNGVGKNLMKVFNNYEK
jgi:hypothetical protein